MIVRRLACGLLLVSLGCGEEPREPVPGVPVEGTSAVFDLDADLGAAFYDFPYPSDLRRSASGGPDLAGVPISDGVAVTMLGAAQDRPGFPMMPAAYFRFDGTMLAPGADVAIEAVRDAAVLLIDVDPASPDRGTLYPTSAQVHAPDAFTPPDLLAVGVWPGVVLHGGRQYAFVVTRHFGDAAGKPLGVPGALVELAASRVPTGARGEAAAALYAPLFETLHAIGVARTSVAAATVFTTGDVVDETRALSEHLLESYQVSIDALALDPTDGSAHPRFCELHGTMTLPQFQVGTPPFDTEGAFEMDGDALVEQRQEIAPVVLTIPKQPMPAGGYPLVLYIHGSGGVATQVVDRGKINMPGGEATPGEGPAHVVAEHGFAAAASAMPLNPERVPGADSYAYINQQNLGAFGYTFRQGVFEQRLFIDALAELRIDPTVLAGCNGPALPDGETHYFFDLEPLVGMGQSMGAQYLNLLTAVEPRLGAIAPTGAGGHWSKFMVVSQLFGGVSVVAAALLGIEPENLTHLHPALHLLQTSWEPGDALASLPRIARRPFDGHPVRSIYQPVGRGDEFFPTTLFDAMAMGYGSQQAGETVWPSMQEELSRVGLGGIADYPVSQNRTHPGGDRSTSVVVQYEGDGIADPHTIFSQLDDVKYQYGCFLATFRRTGVATVPAPATLGTPCPR